jgi:hypothetical protein
MKQLLLFTLLISCFQLKAQNVYSTYQNTFMDIEYPIMINVKDSNDYTLYIDAYSVDQLVESGGVILKKSQIEPFAKTLGEAKSKYEEWVKTAKTNKVDDLSKTMTFKFNAGGYFKLLDDWYFQFDGNLMYSFKITKSTDKINYLLLIYTGELEASSNEYITSKGFFITFTSSEEIDSFISLLSEESIKEFIKKPKTEDLFKD